MDNGESSFQNRSIRPRLGLGGTVHIQDAQGSPRVAFSRVPGLSIGQLLDRVRPGLYGSDSEDETAQESDDGSESHHSHGSTGNESGTSEADSIAFDYDIDSPAAFIPDLGDGEPVHDATGSPLGGSDTDRDPPGSSPGSSDHGSHGSDPSPDHEFPFERQEPLQVGLALLGPALGRGSPTPSLTSASTVSGDAGPPTPPDETNIATWAQAAHRPEIGYREPTVLPVARRGRFPWQDPLDYIEGPAEEPIEEPAAPQEMILIVEPRGLHVTWAETLFLLLLACLLYCLLRICPDFFT